MANSVATVYGWKNYYQPVLKTVVDIDETLLDRYVGKYEVGGEVVKIRREGKKLLLNVYADYYVDVNFTSETDFFVTEFQADLKFMIDAEGKVTAISMNGMPVMKVE